MSAVETRLEAKNERWSGRPLSAAVLRVALFVAPLAGSVVFVHFASRAVAAPTGSLLLFLLWWLALSGAATVVLVAIERVARRLLPSPRS